MCVLVDVISKWTTDANEVAEGVIVCTFFVMHKGLQLNRNTYLLRRHKWIYMNYDLYSVERLICLYLISCLQKRATGVLAKLAVNNRCSMLIVEVGGLTAVVRLARRCKCVQNQVLLR